MTILIHSETSDQPRDAFGVYIAPPRRHEVNQSQDLPAKSCFSEAFWGVY